MDAHEISVYTAVMIASVFLGGTSVLYLVSAMRQHKRHSELQRNNFLQEITILEKERTRIARDLHDELAPLLTMTKYQVDNSITTDAGLQEKASRNLVKVMLRLGEIAADLNADKLVRKGLQFAIKDFVLELESVYHLQVRFSYDIQHTVSSNKAIHFYRITQEIAHNVIKHSAATRLNIRFKERKGKLYLLFCDNGKGFNYEETLRSNNGIGLHSIRSRAMMLGGSLQCNSSAQKGTRYFFAFPLKTTLHD